MVRLILGFSLITLSLLQGAKIRVATFNTLSGIEEAGTTSHDSLKAILSRIDADVVGLQEVVGADLNGSPSNLDVLAASLGYPHLFVPSGIALDTNSRVALLSKFPFGETHSIASPTGAKDVVRAHAAALVDVPGTDSDPIIITLHLKCCFELDDFFRRAVEMERLKLFLDEQNLNGSDKVIVMGDFNLLGTDSVYTAQPPGLPISYLLGTDITFPLSYFNKPTPYLSAYPLLDPSPRQQDGATSATYTSGSILDHMIISPSLLDNGPVLEIYNSELESTHPGLPKSGAPLPFSTSDDASDHYPIFGDFNLDLGVLPLDLTLTSSSLTEGGAPILATVTLPSPPTPGETVTVLLQSSDGDEAMPSQLTLTFTAGVSTQSTQILALSDSILDGPQTITLTASASGFLPASTSLTVLDQDRSTYLITAFNSPMIESFPGFLGQQTPASWTSSNPDFQGFDNGNSKTRGPRSYGIDRDGSLGILTGDHIVFSGDFQNTTASEITSLKISYTAEQWQSFLNGGLDQLEVSLITQNGTFAIPPLTFTAANTLPTGPITDNVSTYLETRISGLAIPPNSHFQLQFRAIPGAPGNAGADLAFINEFHYDNRGSDEDEFVEIILGPSFTGSINDLSLHFYNEGNSSVYKSHTFSETNFHQSLSSGQRIYSASISGIQNGPSDGLALVQNSTVLQFISYEGQLTAVDGPAAGMTSIDVGPSQNPAPIPGTGSLGLTGQGTGPADFTWLRASGDFSQGDPNENQTFGVSTQGQGFAIDDLSVTALPSTFTVTLTPDLRLTFPTKTGASYLVESSTDLQVWTNFGTPIMGDGFPSDTHVSPENTRRFFRVKSTSF